MSLSQDNQRFLLCRLRSCWCALELAGLGEVMRPQPVDPVAGLPPFVEGLAIIRGQATPVLDLSLLLCGIAGYSSDLSAPSGESSPLRSLARFVTVDSGGRRLALRVDEVAGIQALESSTWAALPALVENPHGDHLSALGQLEGELVMRLRRTRLLDSQQWAALSS